MSDVAVPKAPSSIPSAKAVWASILRGEMGLALGVVGIIVLLILPVPPILLDMLLAISLTGSVLILMTAILIKRPLEFTSFPTVLLVSTCIAWA
jgi:flagellar biosynthesis protein FlhA